jgi:hypothetical protein
MPVAARKKSVKRHPLEKTTLQGVILVAASLPVFAGLWDVLHSLSGASAWAVNHERYLSGLLLAIGLGFWSTVPAIETKTARVRLLTFLVAVGGLCRLVGVLMGDPLSPSVIAALVMELVVTPSLCLWQSRLAIPAAHAEVLGRFSPQFDS